MPYYQVWEEFSRAVEKLYLTDPMKVNRFLWLCASLCYCYRNQLTTPCLQVRVVLKYRHCDGNLCIKVTDNAVVSSLVWEMCSMENVVVCTYLGLNTKHSHWSIKLCTELLNDEIYGHCLVSVNILRKSWMSTEGPVLVGMIRFACDPEPLPGTKVESR